MDIKLRDKIKKMSFKRFINSFKFSFQGFAYAYTHEQSVVIHVTCALLAISAGIYFNISRMEWFFVTILIGLIVTIELMNTSIEATIDLITDKYHPLAKIAKDTASAAVFTLAVVSIIGALIIFLPKIIERFL